MRNYKNYSFKLKVMMKRNKRFLNKMKNLKLPTKNYMHM